MLFSLFHVFSLQHGIRARNILGFLRRRRHWYPIRQPLRPVVALQRRALQRRLVVALPAVAPCCQPPSCGLRPDLVASCPPSRPAHPSTIAPSRRPAAPSGHRPASRRALLPAVALPSCRSSVWSSPCLRLTVAPCPSVASCPAVVPCHRVTSRRALSSRPSSRRVPACDRVSRIAVNAFNMYRVSRIAVNAFNTYRVVRIAVNAYSTKPSPSTSPCFSAPCQLLRALLLRARALPASPRPASAASPRPAFRVNVARALLQLLCSVTLRSAALCCCVPNLPSALPSALQTSCLPPCRPTSALPGAVSVDADALQLTPTPTPCCRSRRRRLAATARAFVWPFPSSRPSLPRWLLLSSWPSRPPCRHPLMSLSLLIL